MHNMRICLNLCNITFAGVLVSHYLQSVTPSVALGAELAYQYGPNVPGGEIAILGAAARYTGIAIQCDSRKDKLSLN